MMASIPSKRFLFFTILYSALTAPSVQAANDIKGVNLLHTAKWNAATDSFGSSFNASEPLVQNEQIQVQFTLAKKQEGKGWPFVELVCATATPLTGVDRVEITYRAESDVAVKFSQSDFGAKGDGSYAHYQTVIPASTDWVTTQLHASDFKQPSWAPESAKDIPLNLSNVQDIYLSPKLNFTTGETKTLWIKSLKVL
ncbi:carbohydrate binding domain-containing protein [Motilimonas sp. E26]|uniref:carbohydrate binding domain-containing protein n=1 Tax=Motilimonas sp. E26 TaxID=2865674 RepID=UPI001E3893BE|nr:carbohydrate binding domain-containing protein [Motilimonas sp. E26]MCE0557279.1 hypothetical protein [Motilimonas sp. E26]